MPRCWWQQPSSPCSLIMLMCVPCFGLLGKQRDLLSGVQGRGQTRGAVVSAVRWGPSGLPSNLLNDGGGERRLGPGVVSMVFYTWEGMWMHNDMAGLGSGDLWLGLWGWGGERMLSRARGREPRDRVMLLSWALMTLGFTCVLE